MPEVLKSRRDEKFQRRIERIKKTFKKRDVAPYRAAVKVLLAEAQSLTEVEIAARLRDLLRLRKKREDVRFDGLEPIVCGYLKRMNRNAQGVDSKALAELKKHADFKASILDDASFVLSANPRFCARFWEQWAREVRGDRPPGFMEDGFIPCLVSDPVYDEFSLTDQMILPPVEACDEFVYVLNPPADIPQGFVADSLPGFPMGGAVRLNSDGKQVAIFTQPIFHVPITARTEVFTIRLSVGGQHYDFQVTLPVRLAIHKDCEPAFDILGWNFAPGATVSIALWGSGPQGQFHWSWNPTDEAPLPAGLVLESILDAHGVPTGNAYIHGQVQEGANSSVAYLRLEAGNESVERLAWILIPVHLRANDRAALTRLRDIARGEVVSIRLPVPLGGNGQPDSYSWAVESGSALPDGLAIAYHDGAWWVEGTVAGTAQVETRRTSLQISGGTGELGSRIEMSFRVGLPFRVWTQNCRLFPSDYITVAEIIGLCLWPFAPPCVIANAVERMWDRGIQNTDEDNEQRANFLLSHLGNPGRQNNRQPPYDIVALQEVWDGPFASGELDTIVSGAQGLGYAAFEGPGPSGFKISSGLVLLVRNPLFAPQGEHAGTTFDAHPGIEEAIADNNFDGLAEKGFTFTRVHVGPFPDEFIYVVNTHTQANENGHDESATRSQQIQQIRDYVDQQRLFTHPVVFMGDLNITAANNDPEYQGMINALGSPVDIFADGVYLTDDNRRNAYDYFWGNPNEVVQQRIDYMLVSQGTQFSLLVDAKRLEDEEFNTYLCRDPRGAHIEGWLIGGNPTGVMQCYLSDHFGLSAILRLVRN